MSASRTVFVVEDDDKIAGVLRDYLQASGYNVRRFANGSGVLAALRDDPPSAVILDLGLPDIDGFSLCQRLREFSAVPVLMVTARVSESERLAGLQIGADDYVCKPFSASELVARVHALIRRDEGRVTQNQAQSRPYSIDLHAQRIAWRGSWLALSPAEFRIAAALMKQPGRVFSRDQLLDRIGDGADESSDRAIDSHVKNIRKKLAAIDPTAQCFVSVYGVGYRFDE